MDHGEKARALHDEKERKLNCASAVLCSLEDVTGLDYAAAAGVGAALGGGVRCGEVCGAVLGGAAALGLCASGGDGTKDSPVVPHVNKLTDAFRAEYGCLRCEELKEKYGKDRCSEFISYCARLAAAEIEENTK